MKEDLYKTKAQRLDTPIEVKQHAARQHFAYMS